MIELLVGLLSGGGNLLLYVGGAFIAAIAVFMSGRISGARRERDHNRAKDADAYEQHLKKISDASDAGNRVDPDGELSDDPYNRDG